MKYLKLIRYQNLLMLAFMQLLFRYCFLKQNNIDYFFFRIDDGQTKSMIKDGSNTEVTDGFTLEHISNFKTDISDSRTFSFLHEIEII